MKIKLISTSWVSCGLARSLRTEERRLTLEGGDEDIPPRVIIDQDKAYILTQIDDPEGYQVYGVVSAVLLDTLVGE